MGSMRKGWSRWVFLGSGALLVLGAAREPCALPEVVADPRMPFSTWLGGSERDFVGRMAMAPDGTLWIAGSSESADFPGPIDGPGHAGGSDVVVLRFDTERREVLSTLLLGGSGRDGAEGVAFDAAGNAFVCGSTRSSDFPTRDSLEPVRGLRDDAFVSKISPDGRTVLWTVVLGGTGSDRSRGVVVDGSGDVVLLGDTDSDDFPMKNALQAQPRRTGGTEGFLARIRGDGTELVFSTRLGDAGIGYASCMETAHDGGILVAGRDSPVLAKFDTSGPALLWSTLLANTSGIRALAVDDDGSVVVLGITGYPDLTGTVVPAGAATGEQDIYLARVDGDGEGVLQFLRFGGTEDDFAGDLALSPDGTVWVAGATVSPDLPIAGALRCLANTGSEAFAAAFDLRQGRLLFSTFLGGEKGEGATAITLAPDGSAWIAGSTESANFPTAVPLQAQVSGESDLFLMQLLPADPSKSPATPEGLVAEANGPHDVRLSWTKASDDESGFAIYRKDEDALPSLAFYNAIGHQRIAVIPAGSTGWVDSTVRSGRKYSWSVQAFNADGGSGPSAIAAARPPDSLEFRLVRGRALHAARGPSGPLHLVGAYAPAEGGPDPQLDPRSGGLDIRLEDPDGWRLTTYTVPPGEPGWKRSGKRWTWREPGRRRSLRIRLGGGRVKLFHRYPWFVPDPLRSIRVRLAVGDEGGSQEGTWREVGRGTLRYP